MSLPIRKPNLVSVLATQCPKSKPSDGELDQFLRGVVWGDLCEDDSGAYLAGQVGSGLTPVLGQVADLRDLAVATDRVERGEPGADWMLFAAVIGFLPGFDFLKGGAKASRRELVLASKHLGMTATEGLERVARRVDVADLRRLAGEVRVLSAARTEALARIRTLADDGNLDAPVAWRLRRCQNAITDHLKPDDLVGALRDALGDPVELAGRVYQHDIEVREAGRSIGRLVGQLGDVIRRKQATGEAWIELSKDVDFLSEYHRRIMRLIEENP